MYTRPGLETLSSSGITYCSQISFDSRLSEAEVPIWLGEIGDEIPELLIAEACGNARLRGRWRDRRGFWAGGGRRAVR